MLTLREYLSSPLFFFDWVHVAHLFSFNCVVFAFWVPCCDARYDFRIKTMFGSSLPPVFVGGRVSCLRYLCLFAHSGVHHILCCVVFCFSSSCVPYVASFSGLSFFDCSFDFLENLFLWFTTVLDFMLYHFILSFDVSMSHKIKNTSDFRNYVEPQRKQNSPNDCRFIVREYIKGKYVLANATAARGGGGGGCKIIMQIPRGW